MRKYIIFALLVICVACHSNTVYETYTELPDEIWDRYHVAEFKANIPDSGLYVIKLCIRHTTDYEMANLWCFLSTRSRAPQSLRDTINIKIAEPDGRWLGNGGSIKTLEQSINRNPVNLPQGEVLFRLEQGMRVDKMRGIKNVGIKVVRMNERLKSKD